MKPFVLIISAAVVLAYLFFALPQVALPFIIAGLVFSGLAFLNMLAGDRKIWEPVELISILGAPLAITIGLILGIGAPFEPVDLAEPLIYFGVGAAAFAALRGAVRWLVKD
ncbi:hypothetical protein GC169_02675 [bacterium]|nr:hypothetical protein [bacterium]